MKTVRNVLNQKGYLVWSTGPDMPVLDALKLMAEKDIGALLVLDGGKATGIFSERDYARKVILKGKTSRTTPVKDIMSAPLITARLAQTMEQCMSLMARHRIRHLPVEDGGVVVGMISIGDVVSAIIEDQQNEIQRLEQAAQGSASDLFEV
jgi:CBS domain-containing protein